MLTVLRLKDTLFSKPHLYQVYPRGGCLYSRAVEKGYSRKAVFVRSHTPIQRRMVEARLFTENPRKVILGNSEDYKGRKGPGCREPRRKGKLGFASQGVSLAQQNRDWLEG